MFVGVAAAARAAPECGVPRAQKNVAGLQIPVNDAGPVRCLERRRDLDGDLEGLIERQGAFREPIRQRRAFEVLHDEKRRALLLAHVVQRADMRVSELRDRAGFAIEPLTELRIRGQLFGQDLDRDGAVEASVASLVHLPHPTGAEKGEDFVGAETSTGR